MPLLYEKRGAVGILTLSGRRRGTPGARITTPE